jgi:hypothetical protein
VRGGDSARGCGSGGSCFGCRSDVVGLKGEEER